MTSRNDKLAERIVESLLGHNEAEPGPIQLRPFTESDWTGYSGAERPDGGEPLIGEVSIGQQEAVVIVSKNSVQVLLGEDGDTVYDLATPFSQGKAVAASLGRVKSTAELKTLGFQRIN
mgnify:CR=1 FL=1